VDDEARDVTTKAVVVKARSHIDRLLVNDSVTRIFDLLPSSITRAIKLQAEAQRINARVQSGKIEEKTARTLMAGVDLQFRILKETVLDRCVPTLARVDMQALVAMLPNREAEKAVVEEMSDEQKAKHEAVVLLRAAIAKLSATPAADGRPELFIIRRDDAQRAG
jgi:hypothetical protein